MVADLGLVKSGDWEGVLEEIKAVKASCKGRILKVIVEACLLTCEEKQAMCRYRLHVRSRLYQDLHWLLYRRRYL